MIRLRPVVYHLCRLALGALFVYAGAVKADDVTAFAGSIAAYEILPYFGNYLVAATLPYIEVLAGLLLLVNRRVRPAALLLAGLTLVFMAVL
ncbi:MAG TPA: MauE/DoxX family redox-associated membrane protein, partial [Deferrimonas sp.]